jgi:hypothetical protein
MLVARAERYRFQDDNEQRQPHGELGEEIVIRDRECEV